jgi:hypothetical protein
MSDGGSGSRAANVRDAIAAWIEEARDRTAGAALAAACGGGVGLKILVAGGFVFEASRMTRGGGSNFKTSR